MKHPCIISTLLLFLLVFLSHCAECGEAPYAIDYEAEGYTSLLNDHNDLSQWQGQIHEYPNRAEEILDGLSEEERRQKQQEADEETFEHWYFQDDMLVYDGTRGIGNIETRKKYGNFELVLDWKIGPKGDSGVYLRNMPQVQIWDPHHQGIGSGGLHNNRPRLHPSMTVDKPVGEWNTMHMRMVSDSVWVTLNGEIVVDGSIQHNLFANYEEPAPDYGPIVLQSHGTPLWFRNVYIKELD